MDRQEQSPSARFYAERSTTSPAEVEQVTQSKDTTVHDEPPHADLFGAFRGFEPSNNTAHNPLCYSYGPRRNSGSLFSPRMPALSRVVYHYHQDPAHNPRQNLLNGHSYPDLAEAQNRIFSQHRANGDNDASWQPQSPPPTGNQGRAHGAAAGYAPPHPVSVTQPAINRGLPLSALSSIPPHMNHYNNIRGSHSPTISEAHRAAFSVRTPPDDLMEHNESMPSLRPSDSASNFEPNRHSASQHAPRREGGLGGAEGNGNDLRYSIEDDQDQVMILAVHGICLTVTQWYLERLRVNWRVRNGEEVSSRWQDANERFTNVQGYGGGSGSGSGDGRGRRRRRDVHRTGGIGKKRKRPNFHRPSSAAAASSSSHKSSDDRRQVGRRQRERNVRSNDGSSNNTNNDNYSSNSHNHGNVLDKDDDDDAYNADSDEEDGYFCLKNHHNKHTPPQSHYPHPRRRRRYRPEKEVENAPRQQNPIPAPTTSLLDNIRHICTLIWRRAQRDREDVLDAEARACRDMSIFFDCGGVIVTYCTRVTAVVQSAVEEDNDREQEDERDVEGGYYHHRRRHHQQNEQTSDVDGVLERVLEAGKAICRILGDRDGLQKLAQLEQTGCIKDDDYGYEDDWVH